MKKTLIKSSVLLAASLSMILALGSCSVDSSDDTAPKSDASSNVTPSSPSSPSTPSTTDPVTPPADISNASVEIVKSEGWLNSAYIIFKQLDGATGYKVYVDDKALDEPLIRYYDTYTYYEQSEDSDLQVKWTKNQSLTKVVRADALGLAAGSHTMKVCATNANGDTEYSSSTMTVINHDRSGFAFAPEATTTPGAYKADGTLKDNAIVIYLTQANKKTVKATLGGTEYTGIQDITQAIKTKKVSNPVDIRIIGTVTAESNDLSCADMKSAYAIGVKEAANVTIEGVGHDATLYKAGVAAFKCDYIEIANLGLMKWGGGGDGDGISLKEDSFAWVHNCDYFYGDAGGDADQAKGDGSMDLKDDSNHVTISYNHFWDSGKMSLCGMKSETGPNWITYHHNWFDHSDSRHPRVRTMTVHVYNNYFDGNSKYGVGAAYQSNIFVEQNFFRDAHDPMMSSMQGTDGQGDGTFSGEDGGVIKAYNNKFVQNGKYQKFQFITNKYDYTNNVPVTAPETHTATLGTDNGDGTYTVYSWAYGDSFPSFITKSAAVDKEDGSGTKQYYQISKEKTGFVLTVPANASKVIVTAKSASSGVTSATLKIGGVSQSVTDGNYPEYTFDVSSLSSTSLDVVAGKEGSINIKSIKVIAPTAWETTYTTGVDLSDIDAYEVDNRSDQVPATVKAKQGGVTYSNFDVTKGDVGLGLSKLPTDPDTAKVNVLKCSGRHDSDYAWTFTNATDDASYALNAALNSELLAYKTSMTKIQGESTSSGESGNSGSGESGDTPSTDEPVTPAPSGTTATLTFSDSGSLTPVSTGITFTVAGDAMDFYPSTGKIKVSKVNSKFSVSFTTPGLSTEKYSMVVGYFNKNAASELEVKASGAESGSKITIAASAGTQGESKNLVGATVNSEAIELAGGTAYTVTRSGAKEFGLVSITITKAE